MSRGRGRPAGGAGLTLDDILNAGLALLDEGGEQGLSMRALAARLGVTPMSLYNHVPDRAGLLRVLSDRVYAQVLQGLDEQEGSELRRILLRYHQAVSRHPHLTVAIFSDPAAFAGVTQEITQRLRSLLADCTEEPELWLGILIDHAHGSGLPASITNDEVAQRVYEQALDRLLMALNGTA